MEKESRIREYHLVDVSPWPVMSVIGLMGILIGMVEWMHGMGGRIVVMGIISMLMVMYGWWRDVLREGILEGSHTGKVQEGIRNGMLWFIFSEMMLFVSIFWAYYHSSLSPSVELGGVWPPAGIRVVEVWELPMLNTLLLLLSGVTVTWSHESMRSGEREEMEKGLWITILLGISFMGVQVYEYYESDFRITDGVYGSSFYLGTGFHGMHVLLGVIMLSVGMVRSIRGELTVQHHVGLEAAIWYWHFVDVVWLFLFVSIYWWGGV
uniref:Cytochrome c oxidase subunit 3 n=1 Tax=Galdieria phlegrea TaxID=1389228 RepID=A0A7H0WB53_9RHOD|nr:cytochrome c oxidase subunit III [Galdieria phlegrea]QNR39782.1 cytochrome c oxidase subunit III [Galdieria phlegrea]